MGAVLNNLRGAGGRAFRSGNIWRSTKALMKTGWSRRTRAALLPATAATDVTTLTARLLARAGGKTINWAGRHPYMATAGGLAAMTTWGIGRGAYDVGRSMVPIAPMNKAAPQGQGPGYNVWGSPRRGPMPANNLGATGDLALALHKSRHKI